MLVPRPTAAIAMARQYVATCFTNPTTAFHCAGSSTPKARSPMSPTVRRALMAAKPTMNSGIIVYHLGAAPPSLERRW